MLIFTLEVSAAYCISVTGNRKGGFSQWQFFTIFFVSRIESFIILFSKTEEHAICHTAVELPIAVKT